jgi:PTS system galactitol-specific IIA component
MALNQYLSESNILLGLEAESSSEVIRQLGQTLLEDGYVKDSYIDAVLEREQTLPTGLPLGGDVNVAIPHTDIEHVIKSAVAMATLAKPVIFQNMVDPTESVEIKIVFLLALEEPHAQIEMLQEVAGVVQDTGILEALLSATDPKQVLAAFEKTDADSVSD